MAHALLEYAKSVDDTYAKQNQLQEIIFQVRGMVVQTGRRKRKQGKILRSANKTTTWYKQQSLTLKVPVTTIDALRHFETG